MGLFLPDNSYLGVALEAVYGTEDARTHWYPAISVDLAAKDVPSPRPNLWRNTGGGRLPSGFFHPRRDVGGEVNLELGYEGYGPLYQAIFGELGTSGAGPYVHTFDLAQSNPSCSLEEGRGTGIQSATSEAEEFLGCIFNQNTIRIEAGGVLTLRSTILGQSANDRQAVGVPTLPSGGPAYGDECGDFTWNGLTTNWRSIEITIDNGYSFRPTNGSRETARPAPTSDRNVRLRIVRDYQDGDWYQASKDHDESDGTFTLTSPDGHTIVVTIQTARIASISSPLSSGSLVTETIELVARSTSTKMGFKWVVTNSQASGVAT